MLSPARFNHTKKCKGGVGEGCVNPDFRTGKFGTTTPATAQLVILM